MPTLYILKRGLTALDSADDNLVLFNAPDLTGTSAWLGDTLITVSGIGTAVRSLVSSITSIMDDLLFQAPQFQLPTTQVIHDEPRNRTPGYSFVTDPRNAWTQKPSVLEYILTTPSVFSQFGYQDADGKVIWYPGKCHDYMHKIFQLQMKLLLAVLLSEGETWRGTELCASLFSNVAGGTIRNVFHLFGFLSFRGSYNKTSHYTGTDKTMVRVPLPAVGQLWVRFLAFLRPIFNEFQYVHRPYMANNAAHFFLAGLYRPVTTSDISIALSKFSENIFKTKLSLGKARQLFVFLTSCNQNIFEAPSEETSAADDQAGHSGQTARKGYGYDSRLPDGLNLMMFMRTARVSGIWHVLIEHEPVLLSLLEAGNQNQARITSITTNLRRTHPITITSSGVPAATPVAVRTLAEAVSDASTPVLIRRVSQLLATSYAQVVQQFSPNHSFGHTSTLPVLASHLTHPYLLTQLRRHFTEMDPDVGFSNTSQALVTQHMFEGKLHVGYISGTGQLLYLLPLHILLS